MKTTIPVELLPLEVENLAKQFLEPKPMRRGSLSVRYVKCNKSGCACGSDDDGRHGPYVSVVRTVNGKTQSKRVPAALEEKLRKQIEDGQQFRTDIEAYWRACEKWADSELAPKESFDESAKKKSSKPPLSRRLSTKSTR